MKLINLTKRDLTEVTTGITYPGTDKPARLDIESMLVTKVGDTPIYSRKYGVLENLPPKQDGVLYIVSGVMLDIGRKQGRYDLVAPGDLVRDSKGKPLGCKGFCK